MDTLTLLAIGLIVIRTVLDLTAIGTNNPAFDGVYAVVFLVIGFLMVMTDGATVIGYAIVGIGCAWSAISFAKKSQSDQQGDKR